MAGISVPVPSVDDGAIVAALHIVWALRGEAATRVSARRRILAIRRFWIVVLGNRHISGDDTQTDTSRVRSTYSEI